MTARANAHFCPITITLCRATEEIIQRLQCVRTRCGAEKQHGTGDAETGKGAGHAGDGGPSDAPPSCGEPGAGRVVSCPDGSQVSDAQGFPIPIQPPLVPRELLTGRYAALWESADRPRAFLASC
eukprot:86339-Rhodomonas_salina.2